MLEDLTKKIAAVIPGTAINLALQRRATERQLRADGYSRKLAVALASKYVVKPLQGKS